MVFDLELLLLLVIVLNNLRTSLGVLCVLEAWSLSTVIVIGGCLECWIPCGSVVSPRLLVVDGFEVDNDGVESVYFTIDERTPNRISSSTTPGASGPSTGASAPKKNRVRRDSLDREGAIEKLALAVDRLLGNVGRPDLAVLEKELKEIPTL
ncbi:hypothetical protein GIB67_010021 [Kingdonia uniflora]|uniref:Uncharacterized protein n=1 Tax=Kingdonia uniflora TaxID=39325 RepID=A0A7J7KV79_9MAGN|nr:hypothetical protein GIB67_010021 [Kingdonia uniflora]